MSISLYVPASIEPPISVALSSTNATDLLTGNNAVTKAMRAMVASIIVVNEDTSNAILVTLEYNDGSADYPIWIKSVAANSAEIVTDIPIRLMDDDWTLKATAGTADKITVTVMLSSVPGQVR